MVSTTEILPTVLISGSSHYELGVSYGTQLKSRICGIVDVYLRMFRRYGGFDANDDSWFISFGNDLEKTLTKYCPHIVDEINGISKGANIEKWKLYMVNARTEIINLLTKMVSQDALTEINECSSIISRRSNILSQNWDYNESMEKYAVVVKYDFTKFDKTEKKSKKNLNFPEISSFISMVEPGMVGKIGFNNVGIGVTLMLLLSSQVKITSLTQYDYKKATSTIPIHILMRLILECPSMDNVFSKISEKHSKSERNEQLPIYTFSCLGISDANNNGVFFECCGKLTDIIYCFEMELTMHTNHYLGCGLQFGAQTHGSSYDRFKQLTIGRNRNEILSKAMNKEKHKFDEIKNDSDSDNGNGNGNEIYEKEKQQLNFISMKKNYDIWMCKTLLTNYNTNKWSMPVMRPYRMEMSDRYSNGESYGTVCTIIMDLTNKEMYITRGNPIYASFFKVCLDTVTDERGTQTSWNSKL